MWSIIDKYLIDVAEAINVERSHLILARSCNDGDCEITEENCFHGYLKPDYGYGSRLARYLVRNTVTTTEVTSWGLYEFPSCCAFCVSTQAYVSPIFQNKGVNKLSNTFRQHLAKMADYSALICTDVDHNVAERRTLKTNGFKDIYSIRNLRTGNLVHISVKEL